MDKITTAKIYKKDTEIIKYLQSEVYKKYNIKMNTQDILHILLGRGKRELKELLFKGLKDKLK
jgi:hypothetical protein